MKRCWRILVLALLLAVVVLGTGAYAESAVKKVSIPKKVTIQAGETYQLEPTLTPADAVTTFTWKSKNTAIAEVDSSGLITAHKAGKTTVTVLTANKKKATCSVTVTPVAMTDFAFEGTNVYDEKYRVPAQDMDATSHKIPYTLVDVQPANADTTVTWTSSNKKVATVSKTGLVTCKKPGTTTITAKAKYGGLKRSFELKVVLNESNWTIAEALGDINDSNLYPQGGIYVIGKRFYVKGKTLTADMYVYNRTDKTLVKANNQGFYAKEIEWNNEKNAWNWDPNDLVNFDGWYVGDVTPKLKKKIPPNKVGTMTASFQKIDITQSYLMGFQFTTNPTLKHFVTKNLG